MTDPNSLRELFNARFDALEARFAAMTAMFQKEYDRQDEAIERLADRTTHVSETKRLTERVAKLEGQIESGRAALSDLKYRMRVIWGIVTGLGAIIVSILVGMIRGWIGI